VSSAAFAFGGEESVFTLRTHYPRSFSTLSTDLSTILVFMGVFTVVCMWKSAKTGTSAGGAAPAPDVKDRRAILCGASHSDLSRIMRLGHSCRETGLLRASLCRSPIKGQIVYGDQLMVYPVRRKCFAHFLFFGSPQTIRVFARSHTSV